MITLTRLQFSGYRSYPGPLHTPPTNRLPLCPLTLIVGRNNTGKSQVLRLLHLLLSGLSSAEGEVLPTRVGDRIFAYSPEDHFHFRSPAHPLSIRLGWVFRGVEGELNLTLAAPSAARGVKVQSWTLVQGGAASTGSEDWPPREAPWADIRQELGELYRRSIALSGSRASLERSYPVPQSHRSHFDLHGARCVEWLAQSPALLERVRAWMSASFPPMRLDVDTSNGELRLLDRGRKGVVNLAEAAEGVQQALPVATLLHARCLEPINCLDTLEQPELHLHDAAHGDLGDLMLRAAGLGSEQPSAHRGQRLVVETHSEGVLLRVRRRIAEGTVRAGDVSVAYVDRDDEGSRLQPIPLNTMGDPEWWPDGVFLERLREVQAISTAQRARRSVDAL